MHSCATKDSNSLPQFSLLEPTSTNIAFSNELTGLTPLNIIEYMYYLDGGGVAVGDINNDGLVDLFFTANEGENKLYLNLGDLVFQDITVKSGIVTIDRGWSTGVTMADVNADGFLDIYVSQLGDYKGVTGVNQLFINSGGDDLNNISFTEQAEAYGLNFIGFATQASFFDYDNDGDLDVYLLNHAIHSSKSYQPSHIREESDALAGDKLMRHDLINGEHKFKDVTKDAGIYNSYIGYGLSISTGDINKDGFMDIFIANDFHENDYLYMNNQDGTFTESLEKAFSHTSRSSMGSDIADFNNDALLDIFVLDMLPDDEEILKRSAGEDDMMVYSIKRNLGYYDQLVRNTLQLNRGNGLFSDIALLSGVYATDWSWTPMICDLDNDGLKDIFITNGIWKRPNDLDYVRFSSIVQKDIPELQQGDSLYNVLIDQMPSQKLANFAFKNNGDLTFQRSTSDWGLSQPVWANGAAYADLDNDGDLDLITNNVNQVASIYRNNADSISSNGYLKFQLIGDTQNTKAVGAKIQLWAGGQTMYQEQVPTRGFHSSMSNYLTFGTGQNEIIDSVRVVWPDGRTQTLEKVSTNQMVTLNQQEAANHFRPVKSIEGNMFKNVTEQSYLTYRHHENEDPPTEMEQLKPHKLTSQGPELALGDVNRDGLEDVFIGGARGQSGVLFIQNTSGEFKQLTDQPFARDALSEDVDATFLDIDNDGDDDLFVVSGGDQMVNNISSYADRLYLNNGQGQFTKTTGYLPQEIIGNGSCVAPGDFDGDGDLDIFIGNRSMIGKYGINPPAYLLENDGSGHLTDVTTTRAEMLTNLGMITDAAWTDIDSDDDLDLVICGEWMPVTILLNDRGTFSDGTNTNGLIHSNGWWNTLTIADMDQDGDDDIIAGNLGHNAKIKATQKEPATLYINDFDHNGILDHIICYYHNGLNVPFATRDELVMQVPGLASKFNTYASYAEVKSIDDIFRKDQLQYAIVKHANTFSSSYFVNNGKGVFERNDLPAQAQFAPIYGIQVFDYNGDSKLDLLTGGNFNGADINYGLYDASYGSLLLGDKGNSFTSIEPSESGWVVQGEVRDIQLLKHANGDMLVLVARNNEELQLFKLVHKQTNSSTQ